MATDDRTLDEQLEYYRARAGEYDQWWLRKGRYDRGQAANAAWFAEVAELESALQRFDPRGEVLELACGTGLWTRRLVRHADRVTAVDAADEVLELNRARVGDPSVRYVRADLFSWQPPPARFDACVFCFWLSHVPEDRFEAFWERVASALKPGGRVMLIDSRRSERSKASDHVMPVDGSETEGRRLDDGREFQIVKRYHAPDQLSARLAQLGWTSQLTATEEFFVHGTAGRICS